MLIQTYEGKSITEWALACKELQTQLQHCREERQKLTTEQVDAVNELIEPMQRTAQARVDGTRWRAQAMTRWTTRKPTTPGWYWWRQREGADAEILNVTADKLNGNTYTWRLFSDGQWSDAPIAPPTEEEKGAAR